jgi:hypothetical protein
MELGHQVRLMPARFVKVRISAIVDGQIRLMVDGISA